MTTKDNKKLVKISNDFYCDFCDYNTSRKYNYELHLESKKHQNNTFTKKLAKTSKTYLCSNCDKLFSDRVTLWRHKQKCNNETTDLIDTTNLIQYLIKENTDFKQMLVEQNKNMNELTKQNKEIIDATNHINISNYINANNNQHFNLNFFLNETCKDAMNIEDFVSSIKINLEDLENTGKNGYVEGISSIFIKNLNNIENHLRPLHCSDAKREIFYIKNNNEWVKESDSKPLLTNAIKSIAFENIKQIPLWKEQNPGCTLYDSKKNYTYLKILNNSMCGITETDITNNILKIISNISKEAYINKKLVSHYKK